MVCGKDKVFAASANTNGVISSTKRGYMSISLD